MSATAPSLRLVRHVLARLGETGQPPERGVELVDVGNGRRLAVLEREYLRPIAEDGRGSTFKLVQASYGGGKTHFLLCLRERSWALGFATAIVGLSPDACPFDNPAKVWQAVARELSLPPTDPESLPPRGIESVLSSLLQVRRDRDGDLATRAWIRNELRRLPMDAPGLRAAVVGWLRAQLDEDDANQDLLGAWLRGEVVRPAEVRGLGVRESIDKSTGLRMLRGLCQLLQAMGVPGLLLGFDELDRNLSLPPRRRAAVADNLRQIVDLCGTGALPGLVCVYAVPPEFMRDVVQEYPALQQRLEAPAALSPSSPQAAVIDLERSELPAGEVLVRIGQRILDLVQLAHGARLDSRLQRHNLGLLSHEIMSGSFDMAHRRAFVKGAVDMLLSQLEDEHPLDQDAARQLGGGGGKLVLIQGGEPDPFDNF